jgi:hypothetical protein
VLQFPAGKVAAPVVAKKVASKGILKAALEYGTTAGKLLAKLGPVAKVATKAVPFLGTALTIGQVGQSVYNAVKSAPPARRRNLNPATLAEAAKPAKLAKQELSKGSIQIGTDTALRTLPAPKPAPCASVQSLARRINKQRPRKARRSNCNC